MMSKRSVTTEATARFGASSKAKAAAAAAAAAAAKAASTPATSPKTSPPPSEDEQGFVPAADDPPAGSQAADTNAYLHEVGDGRFGVIFL